MEESEYRATTANDDRPDVYGVLLCDEIYHYCESPTRLIENYDLSMLRPAGYDLRLGQWYYSKGKMRKLSEENPLLVLEPYELVVASTLEKLNMPHYLIGRWNLRVSLVYRGLLLVTGMQVDPGFSGNLFYTLFNFSTREVQLTYKQEIAMIDFVKTTSYDENRIRSYFEEREQGKKIKWRFEQTKENLEHYLPPYELRSAPEELREQSRKTEEKVDKFQRTISTVLAIMIGVIAVLVAVAGIFVTQLPITEGKIRAVVKEVLEEKYGPPPSKTPQGGGAKSDESKRVRP